MIKKKEKEFFIGKMVTDMKVNRKIIKEKEKELCIILMEIEKWAIIQMINELENMYYLLATK